MRFKLDDRVYCSFVGGGPILLDLRRNRYLKPARHLHDPIARILVGDSFASGDRAGLDPLIRAHIIHEIDAASSWNYRKPEQACPSLDHRHVSQRAPLCVVSAALVYYMWAYCYLRLLGPDQVLRHLARPKRAVASRPFSLEQIVAAFRSLSTLVSRHDRCLVRSIAMRGLCRAHGIDVALIIGVTDPPFAAHCWVQSGSMILNDDLDSVRRFTPLLML